MENNFRRDKRTNSDRLCSVDQPSISKGKYPLNTCKGGVI